MNFSELQREVKSIVGDQSPTILLTIPDAINEAVAQTAEDVRFPELRQVSTVTTSISNYYVNMPVGFTGRLKYAGNSEGAYTILDELADLIAIYPTLAESGAVEYVVCEAGILYYQPIPAVAVSITCIGYSTPAVLVNDTDTPSFIPEFLHREVLVNKAAAVCYNIIEDGVEGEKVNTRMFSMLAEVGVNRVREYISRRRSVTSKSVWSY